MSKESWFVLFRKFGDYSREGPLVPIPNTQVKLPSAEDTWLETAREIKTSPKQKRRVYLFSIYSSIAQSVEHAAVNRRVVGSSPTGGAILVQQFCTLTQKSLIFKGFSCF